jgi:hypothetical protein
MGRVRLVAAAVKRAHERKFPPNQQSLSANGWLGATSHFRSIVCARWPAISKLPRSDHLKRPWPQQHKGSKFDTITGGCGRPGADIKAWVGLRKELPATQKPPLGLISDGSLRITLAGPC